MAEEKKGAEKKEDVPDELPPLPGEDEPEAIKKDAQKEEPAPKPVKDNKEAGEHEQKHQDKPFVPKSLEPIAHSSEDDLFFSGLIRRLEQRGAQSAKEKLASRSIISELKSNFSKRFREEERSALEQQVVKMIEPLKQLEREWLDMKRDVALKSNKLKEMENDIVSKTIEIKDLLAKIR